MSGIILCQDIALTISPNNISEGNMTIMECIVRKDPPSPAGIFVWTVKGEVARNGRRIDIKTMYEPQSATSTSSLTLSDLSWKDTGKRRCQNNLSIVTKHLQRVYSRHLTKLTGSSVLT